MIVYLGFFGDSKKKFYHSKPLSYFFNIIFNKIKFTFLLILRIST